jgi:hypothetical protein
MSGTVFRGARRRRVAAALGALALGGSVLGAVSAQANTTSAAAGTSCPRTSVSAATTAAWADPGRTGVPWGSVGRGWILAATGETYGGTMTLYMVSPGGKRYQLGTETGSLMDWSGDGTRALILNQVFPSTSQTITVLNLKAGTATTFHTYSGEQGSAIFSRPKGLAILFTGLSSPSGGYLPLQEFGLNGSRERCFPAAYGSMENPSGTELVLNTASGIQLYSNGGQLIRKLTTGQSCTPLNWWSSQAIVAACQHLMVYPLSGSAPTALTTSKDDATFVSAWQLPSGTYAEAAACGSSWLEKLGPGGAEKTLTIPGAANAGSVQALGTSGSQLAIQVAGGCDQGSHGYAYSVVDWYNPAAGTATTVLGGPAAGGAFVQTSLLFRS